MTKALTLRPMGAADVDAVHGIETAAAVDPWSRELLANELNGDRVDRHWLVATDARGVIAGFGGLLFVLDETHVMNLAVDPARHREGIASAILARLLQDARNRGATAATLEVRAGNAAALGLYRRFGFEPSGRRPGYYPDGEDAVIMWCHRLDRAPTAGTTAGSATTAEASQC
ncbi:MAG: ribosomal protein S18-alanine N-acetyltransferase [Actinomycetota bacterium]